MELLILAASLLAATLLLLLGYSNQRRLRLPPGPRGVPLFGHLLKLPGLLRSPMNLQKLAQEHGPIITIHLGNIPLILISDPALCYEALIEKGALFASRPHVMSQRQRVLSNNRRSINAANYGDHWRTVRRNLVSNVLSPVRVHAFERARYRAVSLLVDKLKRYAEDGTVVPVLATARFTVFSLLAFMCFGIWLDEEALQGLENLMGELLRTSRGTLKDFVPLLKLLDFASTSNDKELMKLKEKRDKLLLPLMQRSQELWKKGTLDGNCYMSSLITLQEQDNNHLKLSEEDFIVLCSEFLNAGAETTANTLEWSLANLIKFPHVQNKLFEEVRSVAGENRTITEGKLEKLVYLQAVVKETLRKHPPGYTTLPHAVMRACKLGGYDIPTNASLLFNIYAINNDPTIWSMPEEFNPERYLGETGVHADYTGGSSGHLTLIPFGAGRRICPGLGLAVLHVHYILASLVLGLEWCSGGEAVELTPKQEFTVVMKNPLQALVKVRKCL